MGDKVPILLNQEPPIALVEHWRRCLPGFNTPVFINMEEGLSDDLPVMTNMALELIRPEKHFIDPDLLYKLQLKSTIPEIGVKCPRHYQEGGYIEFPCVIKINQSSGGQGVFLVKNQNELTAKLETIRNAHCWTGGIVLQEFVDDVLEVPAFNYYLKKSGEIVWIGTAVSSFKTFAWISSQVNWKDQDHYGNLVYEEFTKPISEFLTEKGYFGLVNFEILVTKDGMYLTDLNPRVNASTSQIIQARYMASLDFNYSCSELYAVIKLTGEEVVMLADKINDVGDVRVIIQSYRYLETGSMISYSIFAISAWKPVEILEKRSLGVTEVTNRQTIPYLGIFSLCLCKQLRLNTYLNRG